MKALILLLLAMTPCVGQRLSRAQIKAITDPSPVGDLLSKEKPPIEYLIRNIPVDSEKFRTIHAEFVLLERRSRELSRKPDAPVYEISQTVSPGQYLAFRPSDPGTLFHLVLPGHPCADGERVHGGLEPQEGLYSYVSVLGATKTLRSYKLVKVAPPPPPMNATPAEFVALLKGGLTFTVRKPIPNQTCPVCSGAGRKPITAGLRSGDGKKSCGACDATGKVNMVQPVVIKW